MYFNINVAWLYGMPSEYLNIASADYDVMLANAASLLSNISANIKAII